MFQRKNIFEMNSIWKKKLNKYYETFLTLFLVFEVL